MASSGLFNSMMSGAAKTMGRWTVRHGPAWLHRLVANRAIGEYGRVLDLQLDLPNGRLRCRVHLAGEDRPIDILVGSFRFEADGALVIDQASCDRAWIDALIQRHALNRRIRLPERLSEKLAGVLY
jgi:hypothetical protein